MTDVPIEVHKDCVQGCYITACQSFNRDFRDGPSPCQARRTCGRLAHFRSQRAEMDKKLRQIAQQRPNSDTDSGRNLVG